MNTEILAAADLLHDCATAAIHENRTRWSAGHTLRSKSPVVTDHDTEPSVLIETWAARLENVNRYIAVLGPASGLALAQWMRTEAHSNHGDEDHFECGTKTCTLVAARQFAREILRAGNGGKP
jgi:hypothetical protein